MSPRTGESVNVSYVMIPFTVVGKKGVPITDLRAAEVSLLVDGKQVATDMFEKSMNAPVSFTILVDASGSMALGGKMDAARAAIGTLLARRQPGDDFALWTFTDGVAREQVAFTDDALKIFRAVDQIKPWGKTAFFDAIGDMPERSTSGRNASRAIILLSDGIDNASELTRRDLSKLLEGISVPIYPLGLREPEELVEVKSDEELSDVALLGEVAALTGGKLYLGSKPKQLAAAVEELEKTLRAQYLIGFFPTGKGAVKYREISLKTGGRVQSVRVRAGYRGTEPPVAAGRKSRSEKKGS
ncbi:MAG TPA: VWA domain-containing protein [Thermoanaerobaculia bacterium]